MVTRAQKQTAWAPGLQNLTENLEPHLAEIKHQGESKFQHPKPLAFGNILQATLHWENRRAASPPDSGSKPAWEIPCKPTDEHKASRSIPPATPTINQHSPQGRLTPHTQ
jgi:hypothetical protein